MNPRVTTGVLKKIVLPEIAIVATVTDSAQSEEALKVWSLFFAGSSASGGS